MSSPLRVHPVSLRVANDFVSRLHRHHPAARGCKFSAAAIHGDRLVGVVIAGRPVSRVLDSGQHAANPLLEVNRLCTDGTRNACSLLYGAAARAAAALGYYGVVTYTLDEEGGASLRAAGWWGVPVAGSDKGWDRPGRRRSGGIKKPKWRWVRFLREWVD